jgi:hypothetical protein
MSNISTASAVILLSVLSACASSRDVEGTGGCVDCHGDASKIGAPATLADAAPPRDAQGNTTSLAVGAHQAHVRGKVFSAGVPCTSCHAIPTSVGDHARGDARVVLRDFAGTASGTFTARSGATAASCAATACHGSATISWNQADTLSCTSCHGAPPTTGAHPSVFQPHAFMGDRCDYCHFDVATTATSLKSTGRALHANGVKNVTVTNFEGTAPSGTYSPAVGCAPGCHASFGLTAPQPW